MELFKASKTYWFKVHCKSDTDIENNEHLFLCCKRAHLLHRPPSVLLEYALCFLYAPLWEHMACSFLQEQVLSLDFVSLEFFRNPSIIGHRLLLV
ncbi:hypothetical protein NPIL_636371 [Nephila pilipes]|uniref:Uncharacterized protein n=1 Tax=Nephila pilipes TaxID=299642 RepID=A0A8X6QIN8_NEPPI|nr:hypothetical protein NPIL_390791 [Nephila pilipes]GFS70804.1 hypothetical protein NPIL_481941 [Nephila pilipes]GFT41054.1 hypothetical protein NPIL_522751 [Nephila pilipes]GFU27308.1 hypothetical protein NPIL_636371 [Nephila pilipes]